MLINTSFSHPENMTGDYFDQQFVSNLRDELEKTLLAKDVGFFRLPSDNQLAVQSQEVYEKFINKKFFIHVGIGGSSLGPEMLVKALQKNFEIEFRFINNIDPDEIADQLSGIDLKKSLFSFVSKSGSTAETTAALHIITNKLFEQGVKLNQLKDYFVFTTDPEKSQLLEIAHKHDISCLSIPSNIGGRFSVLTPVGLLPTFFAGASVTRLLQGAEQIRSEILQNPQDNHFLKTACWIYHLYKTDNINQTILMPYSSKLKDLSSWFTQLWAESLGKKYDVHGQVVHRGLTPLISYGATDQHSQMQLFMEGPRDKFILFISIDDFAKDFFLTAPFQTPSSQKLNHYRLSDLMKAEHAGTLQALKEQDRPFINLSIAHRGEQPLGALIMWLECLTVAMGQLLEINPFDQPGVEAGKKYAFEWLNKNQ